VWLRNPLGVLSETYEYLHMEQRPHKPAAEIIWGHDNVLLQQSLSFYKTLREKLGLARDEYLNSMNCWQKLNRRAISMQQPGNRSVQLTSVTKPAWNCWGCSS